ncbi:MAG TPA: cytochrome c-type biogenesis protein CcmH [Gaiellaceae bacterium]|nr:cytochrome c-type biogenesis protein CcmH [Gaiellaceae bacterium]
MRRAGLALLAALALAAPALGAGSRPTVSDLEDEVVCPTCKTTLDMSTAPIADRMRAFIRARIAAGDSKQEIKAKLVDQFGTGVLAEPPKEGFDLLAWVLPLGGALVAAAVVGVAAWRWSRGRPTREDEPLDPDDERRLDEALARFDG